MDGAINSFEDLKVYKLSRELRKEIGGLVRKLPGCEQYNLVSQLRRAGQSVTANIAEGYGRFHYQENIQFCRLSRGSLYEIIDLFNACYDEGYIGQEEQEKLKESILRCVQLLNGYIRMLVKKKTGEPSNNND